jgi:hypothetical protein
MTDVVLQVCKFTSQLLGSNLVVQGRSNLETLNFNNNYIVIDELSSIEVSTTEQFDGNISDYKKVLNMIADITLDFYGDEALSNAQKWSTIKGLQAGSELQRTLGINILQIGNIQNLKRLTGSQYSSRYQVGVKVWYNVEFSVEIDSILNIDLDFINDK